MELVLLGDLSDNANFRFAKSDQAPQGHLLLRNKFVGGQNARTVETEVDGSDFFGEESAFCVTD